MDADSEVYRRLQEAEQGSEDFIQSYLDYLGRTESPVIFNRWSAIAGLGAWLSQSVWFEFGDDKIYPNMLVQLFGLSGARKSTAVKSFTGLLRDAGFDKFAVEKTSKEKFIEWMAEQSKITDDQSAESFLDQSLWADMKGEAEEGAHTPVLIAADEFNDFFSTNPLEFISFLGVLWDNPKNYTTSTRTGGTQIIPSPCISILSGNTPTTFAKTIPPEAIGQGFFSRLILVHSDPTGIKIAFPPPKDKHKRQKLVDQLHKIRDNYAGPIHASPEAIEMLTVIYETHRPIDDSRFEAYSQRRQVQLIKLCVIHAVAMGKKEIDIEVVRKCNTVLHRTELTMPKALGEFGRSRYATVIHKIVGVLEASYTPLDLTELWERVYSDLDKMQDLGEIMKNLLTAKKVQLVEGGFLPLKPVHDDFSESKFMDWDYLTQQEKEVTL